MKVQHITIPEWLLSSYGVVDDGTSLVCTDVYLFSDYDEDIEFEIILPNMFFEGVLDEVENDEVENIKYGILI